MGCSPPSFVGASSSSFLPPEGVEDEAFVFDKATKPDGTEVDVEEAVVNLFESDVVTCEDLADGNAVGVSETLPGENERLDVYSRDGELLGEMRDAKLPHLFFGDGYAALLTTDDLDVQQIVILRLVETT